MQKLLLVHYGPGPSSVTDKIVAKLAPELKQKFELDELDLTQDVPVLFSKEGMHAYVKRNYHGEELESSEAVVLDTADKLTDRLLAADLLVMVFPMYNFNVPATVKAWIDNVTQPKKLFKYTEYGPVGLSKITKAIVIPISGSTPAGSAKDFLTPYMDFILKFIGVKEVSFQGIYGTKFMGEAVEEKINEVVATVKSSLVGTN